MAWPATATRAEAFRFWDSRLESRADRAQVGRAGRLSPIRKCTGFLGEEWPENSGSAQPRALPPLHARLGLTSWAALERPSSGGASGQPGAPCGRHGAPSGAPCGRHGAPSGAPSGGPCGLPGAPSGAPSGAPCGRPGVVSCGPAASDPPSSLLPSSLTTFLVDGARRSSTGAEFPAPRPPRGAWIRTALLRGALHVPYRDRGLCGTGRPATRATLPANAAQYRESILDSKLFSTKTGANTAGGTAPSAPECAAGARACGRSASGLRTCRGDRREAQNMANTPPARVNCQKSWPSVKVHGKRPSMRTPSFSFCR